MPALTDGERSFSTASSARLRAVAFRFEPVMYSQPAWLGAISAARDSNWPSITAVTESDGHTRVIVCSMIEPSLERIVPPEALTGASTEAVEPSTVMNLPSTATVGGTDALIVPSTATNLPSTAAIVPSTTTNLGSTATNLPSEIISEVKIIAVLIKIAVI